MEHKKKKFSIKKFCKNKKKFIMDFILKKLILILNSSFNTKFQQKKNNNNKQS